MTLRIPEGSQATELLRRLGLDEIDVEGTLSALAELKASPQMWIQLDEAANGIRARVGEIDAVATLPAQPKELGAAGRCFWVCAFLAAVDDIRAWHIRKGIPDDVSWETLADLGRHVRLYRQRTGETGLDTQWWITLHFQGSLYALGRLQFQMYRLKTGPAGPLFWYDDAPEPGFARGDPALGLHIPDSGPLTPEACDDSFARGKPFFQCHFEEHADAVVTCTSWLLDDQLADYLPEDSNIMHFQRRFQLVPGTRDSDASAFHFVFGSQPEAIDRLTPRTTLERAIVQHVKSGKHWRLRTGWLRLPS